MRAIFYKDLLARLSYCLHCKASILGEDFLGLGILGKACITKQPLANARGCLRRYFQIRFLALICLV